MSKKDNSKRIEFLDLFRSFGILLMVMGHIKFGNHFDFFIHAFHMPMFFWISGYLFAGKSKESLTLAQVMQKKARTLLVPYVFFGMMHYLIWILVKGFSVEPLLHLLAVNTTDLPIAGALWFLTALFFCDIMFFIIIKYIPQMWLQIVVVMLIALWGNVADILLPFTMPYAMNAGCVGVGLYYIGYLIRRYEHDICVIWKAFQLSWVQSIILGVFTTALIFMNGYINMRKGQYAIIPLFWVNAILAIIVGVNLAKLIYPLIKDSIIGRWFISIGNKSIIYVCLNEVVILGLRKGMEYMRVPEGLAKILTLTLSLSILYGLTYVITNTRLKVVVGR